MEKAYNLVKKNEDDYDYQLPIIEILQNPYIVVSEKIFHWLTNVISAIYDKSDGAEKLPWDADVDYPGLFVLLVSNDSKVVLNKMKHLSFFLSILLFYRGKISQC